MLFDRHGVVTGAEPNVFTLLSIPAQNVLGKTAAEVHDTLKGSFKDQADYALGFRRLRESPHEIFEDVLELQGGNRVIHRYSAPLFDESGSCLGRVEIYSDITRRRRLEQAAKRAYHELRNTQEQLVQSEKLRAIGEVAGGVAHDFNNTLGIILGNIQLLLRTAKDETSRSRLRAAERAALDGVETVRRIQEFSKIGASAPKSPVDLSAIAEEVIEMTRPVWENRSQGREIRVETDFAPKAVAMADGSEIREVLVNILMNAMQAMQDGGTMTVSTGRSASQAWVKIADTGRGMTEEVRKRVFDPFFTTKGVEGAGLGMSVAYGIVSRHRGRLSIESQLGKGTVVTVVLPAAEEEIIAAAPTSEESCVGRAKILVVDDEAMFADVLAEMLAECGHEVTIARGGAEALDVFKEKDFDLVFTDLGMPHMSGFDLARAIRDIRPETPVALLTGWGAAVDKDELERSAIRVTLAKPVSLEKLSSVVAEMLEGNAG